MSLKQATAVIALATLMSIGGTVGAADVSQTYPNRPLRMVVPFAPGGTLDIIGRILADKLAERLGQAIVIDNRGGANGILGAEIVARAPADGHTLLVVPAGFAVNPSLVKHMPYDTQRDLAPIGVLGDSYYVMVIPASIPAMNVKEFIAWAKARPGQLSFASTGTGAITHLAAELFKLMTGVDMTHVPYKGGGALMPDLLAGRVVAFFGTMPTVAPHVRSGKLRALGVSLARRVGSAPEVPTFIEAGVPGYEVSGWFGLLTTGKSPPATLQRLERELRAVLSDADAKDRLLKQGLEVEYRSAAEFAVLIRNEAAKWHKVVQAAGIKPE